MYGSWQFQHVNANYGLNMNDIPSGKLTCIATVETWFDAEQAGIHIMYMSQ